MSDEIDEAGWTKAMKSQATSDAWRDAQKNAPTQTQQSDITKMLDDLLGLKNLGRNSSGMMKKDPSQFEPITHTDKEPSGLSTAKESTVANIAGHQVAPQMTDEEMMNAVRELVRNKVREVVRKKGGGGGWSLYAPNPGKKGKSKPVGTFPTKLGAKRAELARFPPKDPAKLNRLRKEIDRLRKDPKKAAEKEKQASKQKGSKKESVVAEAGTGTPFASTTNPTVTNTTPGTAQKQQINTDLNAFMAGLQKLPKTGAERGKYVSAHMADPRFVDAVNKHPQGKTIHKHLTSFLNSKANSGMHLSKGTNVENIQRTQFMEKVYISGLIKTSLKESLFREEKTESEWDDYISKLSKNALAGDSKFQNLQKNISKKTEGILNSALATIKKAVGKDVKLKSYGMKHDPQSGKSYVAFGASFADVTVEPIYIHIDGGVPKIDLSSQAKVAMTKVDPHKGKMFRAELVTVQERVLDSMDDLSRAIQSRDKYLEKLENDVDGYVAGLSPLQVSLLKQLLVKKYRRVS